MIYASAMLFKLTPSEVVMLTGYDGMDSPFISTEIRSHHPQELIDMAYKLGYALITIERVPLHSDNLEIVDIFSQDAAEARFRDYLSGNMGLIECMFDGRHHFVAWDGVNVYDPRGFMTTLSDNRYDWCTFYMAKEIVK